MNIRIIIPNCNRNTSPLVAYGSRIADIAGGFTSWQGIGGWKDSQGALIIEPVTIVEASHGNRGEIGQWRLLAADIARDLNQDCVYLAIDGKVEYIGKGNVNIGPC
jgi:hypothetical protein